MPKDRRYTRKELETLRRADLQSLFKMHGMKGANQSTKSMIDALVNLFESATYLSPTRRNLNIVEKPKRAPFRGPTKTMRELKKRPSATRIPQVETVIPPQQRVDEIRTEDIVVNQHVGPSHPPAAMAVPPMTSQTPALSQLGVEEMLEARDRIWETRLRAVEAAFERRVIELEKRVEETIRSLSNSLPGIPEFTLTSSTPTNTVLGKRVEREDPSQTPGAGPSHTHSSPVSKRQRMTSTEEDDSDALSPHTPSPPRAIPRTPSPGHQGSLLDNSRTPAVGTDFSSSHLFASKTNNNEVNETRDFSYPIFATTPRPSEPRSPTLDVPPSAKSRMGYHRGATLTPGRRVASPAPRSVSEAHKELTTITESDEVSIPVSVARRRVASEQTPTRLISASLRGGSVPVSPPQLSPSPSIGDREGGFSFTPFPPVPRGGPQSTVKKSTALSKTRTPERLGRGAAPLDYMEMAMQGMESEIGLGDSTTMATPHRTMLGTERYRDTRFGDVPMVSWGSPSIDLGPSTPASYRREW